MINVNKNNTLTITKSEFNNSSSESHGGNLFVLDKIRSYTYE